MRWLRRFHACEFLRRHVLTSPVARCRSNAKYSMWNMDPSGKLQERLDWKGYRSGHMMYLRHEDLKTANDDIRHFIQKTMPAAGQAAKY